MAALYAATCQIRDRIKYNTVREKTILPDTTNIRCLHYLDKMIRRYPLEYTHLHYKAIQTLDHAVFQQAH